MRALFTIAVLMMAVTAAHASVDDQGAEALRKAIDPTVSGSKTDYTLKSKSGGMVPVGKARIDYSSAPAPTGSLTAVATVADVVHLVDVFDSSGQVLIMTVAYPSGAGTFTFYVSPGGGVYGVAAPSGSVFSITPVGTNATAGQHLFNAWK